MRRMLVLVCVGALLTLHASHAAAKPVWRNPPVSVVHASDGFGLTNGSLSLHRVFSSRHPMLDSFTIYGATYSWTRPADGTFLIPPLTSSSLVTCVDCHDEIAFPGSTPAIGYPGAYESLRLADTANGMSATDVICAKCHDLRNGTSWSNSVHETQKHRSANGQCVSCHLQLPHGGGLPRILGYAGDPSPYSTLSTGLAGIALQNYTPTSWRKRDCTSDCHARPLTIWPSGGSVAGSVLTTAGAPISGATVTIGTQSMVTGVDGTYRLDRIGVGYASVTATATGFNNGLMPAFVTAGAVTTVNVGLPRLP